MKKIALVIEDNNGLFEGYLEGVKSNALISSAHETEKGLIKNLRHLIKSYQENEGLNDAAWQKVDADTVEFDIKYDITAFFSAHEYLKANVIAKKSGINYKLLSHYVTGDKKPGKDQVKKIEIAVRQIGKELGKVSLV